MSLKNEGVSTLQAGLCGRFLYRSSRPELFRKKGSHENFAKFTGKHPCQSSLNFMKKETLAQMFFSEFYEIFKEHVFYGTPPVAASAHN